MDALGLDHAQLAALLDVNRSTLGHWRSGRRTPQYVHARALFGPIDRLESVPDWVE
jgi:DNA-binding transcriptional regulator YiaG